ncbi:MAG: hypothetical protein M0P61_06690 [Ignavibacteriaceae bacterium]|jgi:hypothetical protein|nr:hypothetical protein [Ignavibacteriaceae bacterium]
MAFKRIRSIIFIFSLIILQSFLHAQTAGLNMIFAAPQNEFKTNVKNLGVGVGMEGLLFFGNSSVPFGVGLNIGFINYGNEDFNAPLSTTLPGITVNVTRSNNIANFHILFRMTTNSTVVKPYLDLLFGGNYLFTESKVTSEKDGSEFASSKNISDYAWSYGFGGGLLIKIYEPNPAEMPDMGELFLDFKVRYLKGTEAEYLTEGSIIGNPNGSVTLLTSKSKTDLLQIQVGVTAQFNSLAF